MSFQSGRVSYCRFLVNGDAPTAPDAAALSILSEFSFKETEIGAPDEIEAGFVTGQHILDNQFTYEKNGFGDALLFAMRIDTHKVPSDLKKAYQQINEQAAAADNPSGFATKNQKREAKEEAARQLHDDLAAGKFRRSKMIPIYWDLGRQLIFCGAAGNAIHEQLAKLMREAFNVKIEYASSGIAAAHLLRSRGLGRDYEDFHPSAFTKAPAAPHHDDDEYGTPRETNIPDVPWIAKAVDLKDFLGNEFLLWLWRHAEISEGTIETDSGDVFVALTKAIELDCCWDVTGKAMLKSDAVTRMLEAGDALQTGKWPRKASLILSDGEHQWELTFQADKFIVSSALLPTVEDAQSPRELLEARLHLTRKLDATLDNLYSTFLKLRASSAWNSQRTGIREWIIARTKPVKITPDLTPVVVAHEPTAVSSPA